MTIKTIPTRHDGTAHYSQTVVLDGTAYLMYMHYNSRDLHWYMTIHKNDNTPIQGLVGRKLVVNYNPAVGCTSPDRPPGAFLVASSGHSDPELLDLGKSCLLQYIPIVDLEALRNG